VTPEDIVALRKALKCTSRELAEALGVEARLVLDWEREQRFPTKAHVEAMARLREAGPGAVPKMRGRKGAQASPLQLMADPEWWRLLRKLMAHTELRAQVLDLASRYDDPS
jgi:transcriptional regulator with XRE-family HTH domain